MDYCSEGLASAVYACRVRSDVKENNLRKAIKNLSVKSQNYLVNILTFLTMGQDRAKHINSFAARLKGQAAVCI